MDSWLCCYSTGTGSSRVRWGRACRCTVLDKGGLGGRGSGMLAAGMPTQKPATHSRSPTIRPHQEGHKGTEEPPERTQIQSKNIPGVDVLISVGLCPAWCPACTPPTGTSCPRLWESPKASPAQPGPSCSWASDSVEHTGGEGWGGCEGSQQWPGPCPVHSTRPTMHRHCHCPIDHNSVDWTCHHHTEAITIKTPLNA